MVALSEGDWIAIATSVVAATISLVAVYLAYRLQVRTSKRERFIEAGADAVADLSTFVYLILARTGLNLARREIDSWGDAPTPEQSTRVIALIGGANLTAGVPPLGESSATGFGTLTKPRALAWWTDSWLATSQSVADTTRKLHTDGATLDLLRPDLGFRFRIHDFVHDVREKSRAATDPGALATSFRPSLEQLSSELSAAIG